MPRTIAGREPDWRVDGVASKANAVARVSPQLFADQPGDRRRGHPGPLRDLPPDIPRQLQHEIRRAWRGPWPLPGGLETAHVRWHSQDGPDVVANGLALCALHHALFDLGVLGLTVERLIRVSELVRLAPLIRPLVELHWTRMVAAINHVATEEQDLHRHLFGQDRLAPPKALREGLASLQAGRCFYCGTRLVDITHARPSIIIEIT